MEFVEFRNLMERHFDKMLKNTDMLYKVDVSSDEIYETYLASFPEESRQSHTCNLCRQFIVNYGSIVAIKDMKVVSIWDFTGGKGEYENTAQALSTLIHSKKILSVFITKTVKLGTPSNRAIIGSQVHTWNHFALEVPFSMTYGSNESIESVVGAINSTRQVFTRGLNELTIEATSTVLDLIAQNSLYRGAEFKSALADFHAHQKAYAKLKTDSARDLYTWVNYKGGRIRNTAIGQLLIDLSNGVELEKAVAVFERIVAPTNYRRSTSLITPSMIKSAEEKIKELNLTDALVRRHATAMDVPVDSALFVYRPKKSNSVFDEMKSATSVDLRKIRGKDLTIDEFLEKIKGASSLEIASGHQNNIVSLIAPTDNTEKLFSWDNNFSWVYRNNLADSIKEKVKAAGGSVDGVLRVSLEWYNHDDLDLYVTYPNNNTIYYCNPKTNCGALDVDANLHSLTMTPVENIIFNRLVPGDYSVRVDSFRKRHTDNVGFTVQIETKSGITNLKYEKPVGVVRVCTFTINSQGEMVNLQVGTDVTKNVDSNIRVFEKVNLLTFSPNHWTNEIGNKHLFFFVDGMKTDEEVRPFMNEFLKPELNAHRKVFEVLGSKLKIEASEDQLTGYGYSLTQRDKIVVRIDGAVYNVNV